MRWGANQAGMQAGATVADDVAAEMLLGWETHRDITIGFVEELHRLGLHKQWAARLLEPHQIIKTVATMTEVENFFWLRCDNDAQDEIVHLAEDARAKFNAAEFRVLKEGEWHVPYFKDGYWNPDMQESLQDALAISSSCCAQVSYRKLDDSLEKAEDVYGKLINGRRVHASPFEHQATPIGENPYDEGVDNVAPVWKNGITHMDRDGAFWSGNFKGFIQHRQLIPNHVKV
jgi:hypothetical protein